MKSCVLVDDEAYQYFSWQHLQQWQQIVTISQVFEQVPHISPGLKHGVIKQLVKTLLYFCGENMKLAMNNHGENVNKMI